jgi:hypothetical protein
MTNHQLVEVAEITAHNFFTRHPKYRNKNHLAKDILQVLYRVQNDSALDTIKSLAKQFRASTRATDNDTMNWLRANMKPEDKTFLAGRLSGKHNTMHAQLGNTSEPAPENK